MGRVLDSKIVKIILGILGCLVILGVNYWLIAPWFAGTGPADLGSIEVSYVSMGRFIRDFYPHLSFAPYWYFGFPFHLFYTPLLPFLEAILNWLTGIGFWQAYRWISGAGFILAPVTLFLFVWYLTKKIISGLLAGFWYSLGPTLFYFILPSGEVARDVINKTSGFWDPRRLTILARWGEGPHTLSLAFIPLAGLFFLRTLEKKKLTDVWLTAIFLGLIALTNAVGLYIVMILFLAIFFSQMVKGGKKSAQTIKFTILTAVICYGLIAFWYNFSFLGTFFGEGGGVLKNYLGLFPWGFLLILVAVVLIYYLLKKVVKSQSVTLSFVWFVLLFLAVYIYYVSAPSEFSFRRLELVPQALRLMTGSDLAFSALLGVLFGAVISFLEKKHRVGLLIGNLIGLGLIVGFLAYYRPYFPYARKTMSRQVDLAKTGEYQTAQWLKENVDTQRGERVYVAGNYSFYLDYFTNVWQLGGALYQAVTHPWPEHIYYQINHEKDSEIALAWLKAANIKYIVVNLSSSRELYKEFAHPEKFSDLKMVYENKGDLVYQVPLNSAGPAKIVGLEQVKALSVPKKADDKTPLFAYADWLDRGRPAEFAMINNDQYKIQANLSKQEGILVQMTYDRGFKANSNFGRLKIEKDPLGFMVLVPNQAGDYEISLVHGRTIDVWLGYLITLSTIVIVAYWGVKRKPEVPR